VLTASGPTVADFLLFCTPTTASDAVRLIKEVEIDEVLEGAARAIFLG
jgi:hypothetical protein